MVDTPHVASAERTWTHADNRQYCGSFREKFQVDVSCYMWIHKGTLIYFNLSNFNLFILWRSKVCIDLLFHTRVNVIT